MMQAEYLRYCREVNGVTWQIPKALVEGELCISGLEAQVTAMARELAGLKVATASKDREITALKKALLESGHQATERRKDNG